MTRRSEGAGELEVYFDPGIPLEEKIIFSRYVHEHLLQKGQDVVRLRHYVCPHCGTTVRRLRGGGVYDSGRAAWALLNGAGVSGVAGDSDVGGRGSVDGGAGVLARP